jgi:phosphoribosylanthranilate isomerase
MSVSVKICGIRSIDSALAAIDFGADFIGLNFVPTSKRKVSIKTAQTIVAAIKGQTKIVGIFQASHPGGVNEVTRAVGLDFIQLHGDEDSDYCRQIESNVIKAISLKADDDPEKVIKKMQTFDVPFFLLDREVQGKGMLVNPEIAKQLAQKFEIFLAGGLTPRNIAKIVKEVKPFAVDVAGGIETDGKEDFEKIRQFIMNAKKVKL